MRPTRRSAAHAAPRRVQPRRLHEVTAALKLDYERSRHWCCCARRRIFALAQPGLESLGRAWACVRDARCSAVPAVEPGRTPDAELHAGIWLPDDEGALPPVRALAAPRAQRLGVRFRFHTTVRRIAPGRTPQLEHIYAPPDESTVLTIAAPGPGTAGSATRSRCPFLARPRVRRDRAARARRASAAAPARAAPAARSGVRPTRSPHRWPSRKATRNSASLGFDGRAPTRSRSAASARACASRQRRDRRLARAPERRRARDALQGAARLVPRRRTADQAQRWKGARPMLPDGPPVLARERDRSVWLNLGHGSSGWALSCGWRGCWPMRSPAVPAAITWTGSARTAAGLKPPRPRRKRRVMAAMLPTPSPMPMPMPILPARADHALHNVAQTR